MFEARLINATILKKILDAIKDLLNEGTFDCSDSGIQVIKDNYKICFKEINKFYAFIVLATSHG